MATKKKLEKFARVPIVAVMGHVDHGKTTFLDSLKDTKVQESEEGGITQNTRAHLVDYKGQKITFIDTPGHEAFSAMRSRGAKVTDIVLLVVAADDGVQPQTIESIKFAKEASVPIVVAVNKMDTPGANPQKVKQELSQYDVLVEEYGGDVLISEMAAIKNEGIDSVLENLLLQAELLELKATKLDERKAAGFVLESTLDKTLGAVGMIILKSGELKDGDYIVSSDDVHKTRKVLDEFQNEKSRAEEGEPVWVIGLNTVLEAGEHVDVYDSSSKAKQALARRQEETQEEDGKEAETEGEIEDEDLLAILMDTQEQEEEIKTLNLIVKTDTKGTLEAVVEQLKELNDDEAEVNILEASTGEINLKDIELAKTSKAFVIGFQTSISSKVENIARRERVPFRIYKIIYELVDEVDTALASLLDPVIEEVEIARAKIKQVFILSDKTRVAGSEVTKGIVLKGYNAFVERNGEEVGRGKITSLRQGKNEVKEVKKGQECGIQLTPEVEIEDGDELVCFKVEKI